MSLRTERIGQQLREEIARVLRDEVTDPRVRNVTLTQVDVAPDLSNAIVQWSVFDAQDDTDPESVEAGLESAAGFLRRSLSKRLEFRRTPALRFQYDPSLKEGSETLQLLQAIRDGEKE
jgi:ribosome-binding factor A